MRSALWLVLLVACGDPRPVPDAGALDASAADAAAQEAGQPDAAAPDVGAADAAALDAAAPDAADETAEDHTATCTDRLDNDGDGYVDCRDFDCRPVSPCDVPEDSIAACTDGMDNDGDDYVDCTDFGCRRVSPCDRSEDSEAACADGFDNDGDGATDCVDTGCAAISRCLPTEDANRTCADQADNDGDGFTDCADSGCAGVSVCRPNEDDAATCTDGADNDGDGARDCADTLCAPLPACAVGQVRVASFNVQTLGDAGSLEHQGVLARLSRVAADVVCLQEVEAWEGPRLAALAQAAGYGQVFQGTASSPMAGGLTNACLSRWPMVEAESLTAADLSPDPQANEVGRDIVKVRLELVPGARYLTVFAVHLKSGFQPSDELRRELEARRLAQAIGQTLAAHPGEPLVALGDLNEELGGSALGAVYSQLPAGLPSAFRLGSDLTLPLTYDPFATLAGAGMQLTEPTHEDSSIDATRIPSGRRIDYLVFQNLTLLGDEVYNPCRDNGVDDPPAGGWLQKSGQPLPCSEKDAASDHRLVFADFGP